MKTFLSFTLLLLLPLFASAQRRTVLASADCRRVISVDLGAHQVYVNGPYGGHFGFNIENIMSEKLTFNLNVKDFVNRYSQFTVQEGLVEHRIVMQPSLSVYPQFALHGFYANVGCGVSLYFDNNKQSLASSGDDLFRLFPDVKLGFQSIDADNMAWNVYIGSGLFIPKKAENMIPIFEVGVKLGLKL